jgi:tRNA threonylcarbamoyladenosine biosynthesis protein TsaB
MSRILQIETATEICSVSLSNTGVLEDIREISEGRSHAGTLTVFINEILKGNNLSAGDLDAIAVSSGPGSYTGLRIGVSVVKGICYGADLPLIAIPTLEAMYEGLKDKLSLEGRDVDNDAVFVPMIDARRMEVYLAMFNYEGIVVKETCAVIIDPETFNNLLRKNKVHFFGSGSDKLIYTIKSENAIFERGFKMSSANMINIAHRKFKSQQFENIAYFEPFYLKDFIATTPKNKMKFKTEAD